MHDTFTRIAENMIARTEGPLHFRILLQPVMASVFAVIAGLKDARMGKPPYFWSLLSDRGHRAEMIRDGWKSVGNVFLLGLALDVAYQFIVQRFVYPGEALLTAILLAILPYLIVRGVVSRLAPRPKP
jgi:hypothetical protein